MDESSSNLEQLGKIWYVIVDFVKGVFLLKGAKKLLDNLLKKFKRKSRKSLQTCLWMNIQIMLNVIKTRNGNQWTEARFNGFVTSILRSGSRRWAPKYSTLKDAYTTTKKNKKSGRLAKHYKCAICSSEFTSTNVQVDHIVPIGKGLDWNEFIEKLFCEKDNLQVLCKLCHKEKTKNENTIVTRK